jgi:hypothetical protein
MGILPINLNGPSWSNWNLVPGKKTNVSVAATALDGILGFTTEIALVLTGESNGVHVNYFNGDWLGWNDVPGIETTVAPCAIQLGDSLYLFVAAEDENVYFNSTSDGYDWSPTWTQVTGAKTKTALCAGADGSLYLVGLHNGIWVNSDPPSGGWTHLVIDGNAFKTNAALCSVQTFVPGLPPALFAKGLVDDEIWNCNPPDQGWSLMGGNALTYVGIAGVTILDDSSCLFLTGRKHDIYFNYSPLGGGGIGWSKIEGFQTNAQLAATVTSSLAEDNEIAINDVYLFAKGVTEGDVQYILGQWASE